MARLLTTGAESADSTSGLVEGGGGFNTSAAVVRTGARSFTLFDFSFTGALSRTYFYRVYVQWTTLPTADSNIFTMATAGGAAVICRARFILSGTNLILVDASNVQIGTGSFTVTTGVWYRVEMSCLTAAGSVDTAALLVDGTTIQSSSSLALSDSAPGKVLFSPGTSATAYADDIALNDSTGGSQNTWPGDGKVVLLLPISNNAVGTGWTLGTGTAISSNGFGSVGNTPPQGVADLAVGSDPKQIRNASANANVNYDANLTTYTTAGIVASDTINVLDPIVVTAAPVTTSSKQGTVGVSANPVIANIALSATGTSGAFWAGATAAAYPTGWKASHGTATYAPSVTLGSSPVMRITQVTSSTRIAMVCFMGMYVDYTPAPAAGQVPYTSSMPQLLAQ
jgi:hypothetical protein